MKKIIYPVLAALFLSGCSDIDNLLPTNTEGQDLDVTACKIATTRVAYGLNEAETEATATWEATDIINIYAYENSEVHRGTLRFVSHTNSDKTEATFKGHLDQDVSAATTLYAYAQYANVYNQSEGIVNDLHFQTGSLAGEGGAATHDVLYASGSYDPNGSSQLKLTFARKMALAKVTIALPEDATETTVTDCTLSGSGIYNNVTLSIADASLKTYTEGGIKIAADQLAVKDGKVSFYVALYPNQIKNATVVLTLGTTLYKVNLADTKLEAGKLQDITTSSVSKMEYNTFGTITDEKGNAVSGVVVSDGYTCTTTDATGTYQLNRNASAKFVYYTIPADCEVPVRATNDNTAYFYQQLSSTKYQYDFQVKKLASGKETNHVMIVIGDPQVTTTYNPYYEAADENVINKYDATRFDNETMTDIKKTIASLPSGTPVYGLSMGDNVQYYTTYNSGMEEYIRKILGSSTMKVFSVIGNHDQDGNSAYTKNWEDAWGPTDYSFDRGNIHYVCINNVQFYSGASYYQPGELTDAQITWLENDLKLADKTKMVVLSYHIPLTFGNRALTGATSMGDGQYASTRLSAVLNQLEQFASYKLFCGHTHFAVNNEVTVDGHDIYERAHAAACGDIWQSNINIDGTPNGYYVYTMNGTTVKNCYYKGTNWDKSKQMSLFKADTDFNGESYAADWSLSTGKGTIVANVFNADSKWKVYAIENGVQTEMTRLQATPGQDAFAVGYHKKYAKANGVSFFSKANGYLKMNHWYYYEPKDASATITVKAVDSFGNEYTATTSDIVTEPFYNYAHYYSK